MLRLAQKPSRNSNRPLLAMLHCLRQEKVPPELIAQGENYRALYHYNKGQWLKMERILDDAEKFMTAPIVSAVVFRGIYWNLRPPCHKRFQFCLSH